jgi:hypothetical protein
MGAATSILYLSDRFREIVYKFFKYKKNINNLGFVDQ